MNRPLGHRMRQHAAWLRPDRVTALLAITAAVLMVGIPLWLAYQSDNQQVERATYLAADAAQEVERAVAGYDLILQRALAGDMTAVTEGLAQQQRDALLFERTPRDPSIVFLDVLDANGDVLASLNRNERTHNWADREYFEQHSKGAIKDLYAGTLFSMDSESNSGFTISRRITANNGKFAGVAVVGVRLASFVTLLGHRDLPPGFSLSLLRSDGVVMARLPYSPRDIGHAIDPIAPFQAFIHAGQPPFLGFDPVDHRERRFVFHRAGNLPLVIGVTTPVQERSYWSTAWWIMPIAVATAFGCGLLLHLLWREKRRRETAERQSQEKSRFLAMLSHELRTPLQGVLGYADQMSRDGRLNADQTHQVNEIVQSAKSMRDVVNRVLDYARIEALGPALHIRRFDVRRLADECLAIIEPGARARGLEIRCTVDPDAAQSFVTDDILLRQILVNLLSNAVKYTEEGAVELRLKGDAAHLIVEVADTGIGIPAWQRHRLFQDYERFGAERTGIEGTGLGLAIAHRLTRHLGGYMGHRDNPGGGSVFWLHLPAYVGGEAALSDEIPVPISGRRLRVLVVDDSKLNREIAAAFLRQEGHTVTEAQDGNEAIQLVRDQVFDVVLMDMCMPGLNGLETARRIRGLEVSHGQVPIVAVTANALDEHAEACRQAGMSEHLAKPFTQRELIAVVMRAAARPGIEADGLQELSACVAPEVAQDLLDCLALRIEALVRKLETPAPLAEQDLADLTHELIGGAGALGFAQLASLTSRFHRAVTDDPAAASGMVAEVRREAIAALAVLRERRRADALTPA